MGLWAWVATPFDSARSGALGGLPRGFALTLERDFDFLRALALLFDLERGLAFLRDLATAFLLEEVLVLTLFLLFVSITHFAGKITRE